jgi:hypothetical protein
MQVWKRFLLYWKIKGRMERNIVARAREGQLYLGYRIFLLISTEHTHGIGKRNMKKCFLFHFEDQKETSWKLKYLFT